MIYKFDLSESLANLVAADWQSDPSPIRFKEDILLGEFSGARLASGSHHDISLQWRMIRIFRGQKKALAAVLRAIFIGTPGPDRYYTLKVIVPVRGGNSSHRVMTAHRGRGR
jgi:hypothetical protein